MGKPGKPVYLLMAVIVFAAPTMACALPGLAMSEEEKECCLQMADQCGSARMDESHTCCQKTPVSAAATLQPTAKYSPALMDYASQAASALAPLFVPHVAVATVVSFARNESPPGHNPVLRI